MTSNTKCSTATVCIVSRASLRAFSKRWRENKTVEPYGDPGIGDYTHTKPTLGLPPTCGKQNIKSTSVHLTDPTKISQSIIRITCLRVMLGRWWKLLARIELGSGGKSQQSIMTRELRHCCSCLLRGRMWDYLMSLAHLNGWQFGWGGTSVGDLLEG